MEILSFFFLSGMMIGVIVIFVKIISYALKTTVEDNND